MKSNERKFLITHLIRECHAEIQFGEFEKAWLHLAQAHILSQPNAYLHTWVHWEMLKIGIKQNNWSEIWGQFLRLIVAAPGSISRRYPLGNTGRSNVSMFQPMPIDPSLQEKINRLSSSSR